MLITGMLPASKIGSLFEIVRSIGGGYGVWLDDKYLKWFETIFAAKDYIDQLAK